MAIEFIPAKELPIAEDSKVDVLCLEDGELKHKDISNKFINTKELPVAEGDEVDAVVIENGELKRKEGASLGGSGGYIMKPTAEECTLSGSTLTITTNYDEMAKVLEVGGSACVRIPMSVINTEFTALVPYTVVSITSWGYFDPATTNNGMGGIACHGAMLVGEPVNYIFMFTNGTYVPSLE